MVLLHCLKLTTKAPENGWLEDERFLLGWPIFRGKFFLGGYIIPNPESMSGQQFLPVWGTERSDAAFGSVMTGGSRPFLALKFEELFKMGYGCFQK